MHNPEDDDCQMRGLETCGMSRRRSNSVKATLSDIQIGLGGPKTIPVQFSILSFPGSLLTTSTGFRGLTSFDRPDIWKVSALDPSC